MQLFSVRRQRRGQRTSQRLQLRKLLIESLEVRKVLASTPIISEFLASNNDGLRDADGDSSDWIEIYNPTATPFNLAGWKLTDDSSDLNQWAFPSVSIQPNTYLTVFASGKNRAVAGQELHTNFGLSADGDYLALISPTGTIVSQYTPEYPSQAANVSYGPRFENQTLITSGSNAKTLIPSNGTLGNTWQQPAFNDAAWTSTPVGIGFGVVEPGFDLTYYKSNTAVGDLSIALNVISNPSLQSFQVSTRVPNINFVGSGSGSHFGNDQSFPTQNLGDDIDDFVIRATSTITIPSAGDWTFGVNSDDGFRLTLNRNGVDYVSEYFWGRAPDDTLTTFNLPAGQYTATLVTFEGYGGSSAELFAAQGAYSSFNNNFRLVGDTQSGGLVSTIPVPAGPTSPVRTDVSSQMLGVNSTAYLRIPFSLSNPANLDTLTLRMRYDDGFVAYLNGTEVARRNAPNTLAFNSVATTDRAIVDSLVTEDINISAFRNALVSGNNVVAIQGLNFTASDSNFLMLPQLSGSKLFENELRYFATPTPNAPNQDAALGLVSQPTFSVPAGFYNSSFALTLGNADPAASIRYTTDGSQPTTTHGILYTAPIQITGTTTVRAFAYRTDYISLPSETHSYLFLNDILQQSSNGAPPAGWPSSWGSNVVDYGMDPDVIASEGVQAVKDALLAIPTLNLSTDLANLFDSSSGIYANAYNQGRDWERPASLELLNPDGSQGFQVNAGVRIRGGYSRSGDNPKHSFRLFFRGEYGDSTLDYPIAGENGADSFKKIDLRTAQNYSWSFGGDPSNNFVTDVWNRLSQQAMGMPSTNSQWYHLYINGQYWGLYQTQERSESEFAELKFGGEESNYDVIKAESGPYSIYATDGNLDAWTQLWTSIQQNNPSTGLPSVASVSEYMKLQGKNPDGTNNSSYPVLLDVDNLAVYMVGILYGGNLDAPISWFLGNQRVNNFYAVRDRTGREGFKFFLHDSEHTLRDVNENRNGPFPAGSEFQYSNPQWFHQRLMTNAEYRMRFADLVQKYFFHDGVMTTAANQARFSSEAVKIDKAIIAESVRWGDAKRPDAPLTRADWVNAVNGVLGNYFPLRGDIFINQLRDTTWDGTTLARLFPTLDAPSFLVNGVSQRGGTVPPNSTLKIASPTGTVYYTTDGSDPRLIGGGINPSASSFTVSNSTQQLFGANSNWKYRDTGTDLGSSWRASNFNDSSWASGNGEFGYGDGDEATVVGYGLDANNKYITTYFRKSFNVTNASEITALVLSLKRDDGAVIYINGVEAGRSNMPTGPVTASTLAATAIGGSDETTFYPIQIDPSLLVNGNNVIAIEIHQSAGNSSDVSFDASLTATRQTGSPSIPLGLSPTTYKARTLSPTGEWSALEEGNFSVPIAPADATNLIVTEVHYNPAAFTGPNSTTAPFNDAQNFEFIELRNTSNETILLDGVSFTGISYTFPTSASGPINWLLPGEIMVVVKNQIAFAARYLQPGSPFLGIRVAAGDYGTTNLNNGGEEITLTAANGDEIQSFTYDDNGPTGWPTTPDGGGPSLTPIYMYADWYSDADNWRPSFVAGGTPGLEENDAPTGFFLDHYEVNENAPGALVGLLTGSDPDLFDTFTFSIVPSTDGNLFTIIGNELRVGTIGLNYEARDLLLFGIKVTDAAGASHTSQATVIVNNTNDAPTANIHGPYTAIEGQAINLNGLSTDEDVGQTLTYQWDLNYNGVTFDVDASGVTPSVSFPDQGPRTIALRVTDNGDPARSSIVITTVTVSNKNPTVARNLASVSGQVLSTFTNTGTWGDVPADTVTLSASLGTIIKNSNGTWSWSYKPPAAITNQVITITASDEDGGSASVTFTISATVGISAQGVYYKGSGFASLGVNQAIDTSRVLLKSSAAAQTTTAVNFTNYTRGLNGIVLDIPGLASTTLTATDFVFRVAPTAVSGAVNPSTWASAPAPSAIVVTPGNATTAARVRIEWPDNAIQNTWLQLIVRANINTGLTTPNVYYIGNAIGQVAGGDPYRIGAEDFTAVLQGVSNALVPVTENRDIDKGRRIDANDLVAILGRINNAVVLRNITIPAAGSAAEGAPINIPPLPSLSLIARMASLASYGLSGSSFGLLGSLSSTAVTTPAKLSPAVIATTPATSTVAKATVADTALKQLTYSSSVSSNTTATSVTKTSVETKILSTVSK